MKYLDYTIVLNGEIYNYKEIRTDLIKLGHIFNSDTDTEVVLHAWTEWEERCIEKFIGMFAFVVFNQKTLELSIIRDRAGIKPLFYYWHDGLFLFGSELKAFHKHPWFKKHINTNAAHLYLNYGYIPAPYCIFEYCHKLNPGSLLKFEIGKKGITIQKYWDICHFYEKPLLNISYNDAKEELKKLLQSAFEYRMISDVPVGVFLSGGYDSVAVTSMLQCNRTNKLKTFTIGFDEGNNEAPYAKEIAKYLGTEHTEYYCKTNEAQEIIPTLPFFYDEPFADSSAIPTILVSRFARKNVTVALSADAGDEIFAGYDNYRTYLNNLELVRKIPGFLTRLTGKIAGYGSLLVGDDSKRRKFVVLSEILKHKNGIQQQLLNGYVTLDKQIRKNLFINPEIQQKTIFDYDFSGFHDDLSIALATDYDMYLQNDILVKVDRATMSVSLEGREPLLDHRIVEFAAQLPDTFKFGSSRKIILKDIVHQYIPSELMARPKTGFSVPLRSWLTKDLYYLLEENLNASAIKYTALFNPFYVEKLKKNFISGKLNDTSLIWKLLQYQLWFKMWMC